MVQGFRRMNTQDLRKALDILYSARCNLSHADYVKIWGKGLGDHIWRQEERDLLKIWRSGLTIEQQEAFLEYLVKNFGE